MDRRSKIIVSVVGIFIVLLALVGITYAYFLTQVQGNTNDTSISITTANLRLVYEDGQNIEANNIQPGDTVYTKTFTVTNEGNETVDYEVYMENVINDFVHYDDLRMYITCINQDEVACNGYGQDTDEDGEINFDDDNIYPIINSKLIENTIKPAGNGTEKEVHTYTLYLKFRDNGDQSADMGKTLQGKIQIYDPKDVVAITGTVTGYDSSYYLELHSDTKTSEIASDGSYVFYGVEPDNHILYVMKRTESGSEEVTSKSITVTKGATASANDDVSNITINDDTLSIEMNITLTKDGNVTSITTTKGKIEEKLFEEGTLAAKIIADNELKDGNDLDFDIVVDGLYYTTTNTEGNKPTYFYRGNVTNNYIKFSQKQSGTCWFEFQTFPGEGEYNSTTGAHSIPSLSDKNSCESANIYAIYSREAGSDEGGWGISIESINGFSTEEECTSFHNYEYGGDREYKCVLYEEKPLWEVDYIIWRIVRINEDGSVRLLYYGDKNNLKFNIPYNISDETGYYTEDGMLKLADYSNNGQLIENLLNEWYDSNLQSSNIIDAGFCNDLTHSEDLESGDPIYYKYGPYRRMETKTPQFMCTKDDYLFTTINSNKGNKQLTRPIGLLTADEIIYAGKTTLDDQSNSYLMYYENGVTMSPAEYMYGEVYGGVYGYVIQANNFLVDGSVDGGHANYVYPVINIRGDLQIEGNGTTESPYQIVVQ